MRWWTLVGLMLMLVVGCAHTPEVPAVPPPPEDVSTWSVPELVQAPPPEAPDLVAVQDKPTAAEHVYDFTPGTTFAITVPVGVPLDLLLEREEQVRNIVGGDRAPAEASQTPRWEVKEGADGHGETLRPSARTYSPFPPPRLPHATCGWLPKRGLARCASHARPAPS